MNIKQQLRVVCLSLGLTLSALAQDSLTAATSDRRHDDGDKHPPAAPEPALILMAIGGVGVAGGYVALRLYRGRKKNQ